MSRHPAGSRGRGPSLPALAVVLLAVAVAGCAATPRLSATGSGLASSSPTGDVSDASPPSSPNGTPTGGSALPSTSSPTVPAATVDVRGLPPLLIVATPPSGAARLWLTSTGDPARRRSLPPPGEVWRPDAASHTALAFTATAGQPRIALAGLGGPGLDLGTPRALPFGPGGSPPGTGFVACLAASGDLLFADAGLALRLVRADGAAGSTLPAPTRGSCAWTGDDAVLFDVEETHHLGRWQVGQRDVALSDLQLTAPAVGGALVAAVTDDGEPGRIVVLRAPNGPLDGQLRLAVIATLAPADGEAYQGVRLSADDRWLVASGGPLEGQGAWMDVYRAAPGGSFSLAGRWPLAAGEDVRTIVDGG